jgi:hypothetical protein
MKTDEQSEMHNLGYRPPLHISIVTSHCLADSILGKISETSLNIPAYSPVAKYFGTCLKIQILIKLSRKKYIL